MAFQSFHILFPPQIPFVRLKLLSNSFFFSALFTQNKREETEISINQKKFIATNMAISIFEVATIKRMSLIVIIICILIAFKNQDSDTKNGSSSSPLPSMIISWSSSSWDLYPSIFMSMEDGEETQPSRSLEYDFYRDSCPQAEKTIRDMVRDMYRLQSSIPPALLRLAFHDCFIEGCDASILLDNAEGIESEKDSPPNKSLRAFNIIDIIKSRLEEVCPGVVSCADVVVLAAREGIMQAGGPFYPLFTGRKDSTQSFPDTATIELPSPEADLPETLASFASRGFDDRETVSLLGAHSFGVVHCQFFQNRLYNFHGTNKPDPSLDPQYLTLLRSICNSHYSTVTPAASPSLRASVSAAPLASSTSIESPPSSANPEPLPSSAILEASPSSGSAEPSPSSACLEAPASSASSESPLSEATLACNPVSSEAAPSMSFGGPISSTQPSVSFEASLQISSEDPKINMAYEGPGVDFGTLYYRRLLQGRGILYSDQQIMSGEDTGRWVRVYASDMNLFRRDFALAMMKLSNLNVLTGSAGQVRLNCSKVA